MVSVERIKEYQETLQVQIDEDYSDDDDNDGDDDEGDDDATFLSGSLVNDDVVVVVEAYMLFPPNHSHCPQAPTLLEDPQTFPHFTRYSYSCIIICLDNGEDIKNTLKRGHTLDI